MSNDASWADDAEASRRWLETGGAEGSTVQWIDSDLSGRDLRNVVLVEATLLRSDFSDCLMQRADLSRALAGGAHFDRARLTGASFVKAQLTEAHFDGADASQVRFTKSTVDRATFSGAVLRGASFESASCIDALFRKADLRDVSFVKANLGGADLEGADLSATRWQATSVNAATRLAGSTGLDHAVVESIFVASRQLHGADARAWLTTQSARSSWSIADFEFWALARMSSPRAVAAAAGLGATEADLRRAAADLDTVFDQPGHTAAEYRRVLGKPTTTRLAEASGAFAGSLRHEYHLPLWPDVVFVVNEDRNGTAWGAGFEGGPSVLPSNLDEVEPWQWTAERLRREALSVEVHEEWTYDLDATFTFAAPGGPRCYRGRFDLGLLQRWEPQSGSVSSLPPWSGRTR
jgi:uncharacterized protein YjbI with pentapeptide repeats